MTEPTRSEEQVLRRAFHMIGDEAGEADDAPQPRAVSRNRRRITAAFITAAAVGLGILTYSLTGNDPGDGGDASSRTLRPAQEVACAARIVEGNVLLVHDSPGRNGGRTEVTVTLAVKDWIKPAQGPEQTKINIPEPKQAGAPALQKGDRVLVQAWDHPDIDNAYFTGSRIEVKRQSLYKALRNDATATCPDFWKRRQDDGAGGGD